jgi:cytochrome P450
MHEITSPKATLIGPLPDPFDLHELRPGIRLATAANGTDFWLVTDYKLAREILADLRFRRAEASGPRAPKISTHVPAASAIISVDGAEHARVRGLVAHAFTERRIAELKPFVAELVEELLDKLEAQQPPADFVSHVSSLLPFHVLCHILGVPAEDREIFGSWVNVLFRLNDEDADFRQHSIGLARYMMQLVARKRRKPEADLISDLIRSAEQKCDITDRELVTLCLSLLMAGYDSTADQITLCVLMLVLDRPLMKTLTDNPELVPRVVEEFLRLNPAPYITFPRMPMESVSIGGITIEPGQLVFVFIMGANRDPSMFQPTDEVSLAQHVPVHLTFGHGVHRCLGAPLARLQLTTLLSALLSRFPDLSYSGNLSSLDWKTGMATRGLGQLYVSWDSR